MKRYSPTILLVVTVEEHSLIGGLGSAVAEWLIDKSFSQKGHLMRIGIPDEFFHYSINQKSAREIYALSPENLRKQYISSTVNYIDRNC